MNTVNLVGKVNGHFKSKENRAAKILAEWNELIEKMRGMVERGGGRSDNARMAYAVLVMMETGIRVGNEGSAEGFVCENKYLPEYGKVVQTYGLTTLLGEHIKIRKNHYVLSFTGKKLVEQELVINHTLLVQFCPRVKPDEKWLGIEYPELFKFVKKYVGKKFIPKDIRTAKVNKLFCELFDDEYSELWGGQSSASGRKKIVREAIKRTAAEIGHTPAVCKSAYLSKGMLGWLYDGKARGV